MFLLNLFHITGYIKSNFTPNFHYDEHDLNDLQFSHDF